MPQYVTFGLGLHADFGMPELQEQACVPDVVIRRAALPAPAAGSAGGEGLVRAGDGEACFHWREAGTILVRDGREILVDPHPEAEESLIRHLVQGIAMGVLLSQRGLLTLHASAVAVRGEVVAFVGWKGWGKSTTAAALHARGHALVTDDVLALRIVPGLAEPLVRPGVPQLKLWPDAAASLGEEPEALPKIYGPSPKRTRTVREHAGAVSLPLRALYVLDYAPAGASGPVVRSEAMPEPEAALTLIRHSYALRFLGRQGATAEHLEACAHVARHVPMRRLIRKPSLDLLSALAEHVEAEVGATTLTAS